MRPRKAKNKNSENFPPSYKKNLDNLKLLLSSPDIKEIVARARKFLELPPNGLADPENPKTEDEAQHWWGEMYRRSDEIRDSKQLRDQMKKIKEKVQAKKLDEYMAKKQAHMLYDDLPINYLANRVIEIIKNCNLPLNYKDSIRRYIVFGNIAAPAYPFTVVSDGSDPEARVLESVTIEFYAKLTDEDIRSVKEVVNNSFFGENLSDSPEPIKDINNKIKIEEIKYEKVFDEVKKIWYIRTAQEISEIVDDEFKPNIPTTTGQVYENARELKELREKRFKKKFGK